MTNGFLDSTDYDEVARLTLARAEAVNANMAAVVAAFDKMPSETRLKRGTINYAGADTGSINAYLVSLAYSPVSYASGLFVRFSPANTNTGASTINVNSIGAVAIRNYAGGALSGGELVSGAIVDLVYDATNSYFRIINPVVTVGTVVVSNLIGVMGTSTSNVAIGVGSKSFVIAGTDDKLFSIGQRLSAANDESNLMIGTVSGWNSGTRTLAMLVGTNDTRGSGTHAVWTISLSGDEGQPGSQIYSGSGVPSDASGIDGDWYFRTNGDVYQKAAGTWGSALFSIVGPIGPTGPAGVPQISDLSGNTLAMYSQLGVTGY